MAHFNFMISQNAKWGHAGFYIDYHRMTVPENILLQKKHCVLYPQNGDRMVNHRLRDVSSPYVEAAFYALHCDAADYASRKSSVIAASDDEVT